MDGPWVVSVYLSCRGKPIVGNCNAEQAHYVLLLQWAQSLNNAAWAALLLLLFLTKPEIGLILSPTPTHTLTRQKPPPLPSSDRTTTVRDDQANKAAVACTCTTTARATRRTRRSGPPRPRGSQGQLWAAKTLTHHRMIACLLLGEARKKALPRGVEHAKAAAPATPLHRGGHPGHARAQTAIDRSVDGWMGRAGAGPIGISEPAPHRVNQSSLLG